MRNVDKVVLEKASAIKNNTAKNEVDERQILENFSNKQIVIDNYDPYEVDYYIIKNGHFKGYVLVPSDILEDTYIFGHDINGYKINSNEHRKSIEVYEPSEKLTDFDLQIAYEILVDFFKSYVEGLKRSKPLIGEYSLASHENYFELPDNIFDIHTAKLSAKKIAQDLLEQSIDKLKKDFPNLTKDQIKIIKNNARRELVELIKANSMTGSMMGE